MFLRGLIAFRLQRGFSLWVILEVNFLAFMGLLSLSPQCRTRGRLNYFLIQALGRRVILISILLLLGNATQFYATIFFYALVIKLGGAPFHNWYLMLVQKLSWGFIWILSCWQKIVPLLLMSLGSSNQLRIVVCATAFVGSLGVIKQTSLKKVFAFSSIFTLRWVLRAMLIKGFSWLFFFGGYALNLGAFVICVSTYFPRMLGGQESSHRSTFLVLTFIALLMMRGVPPFLGFFLKLLILNQVLTLSSALALFLVRLRLFIVAAYIRILFNLLTLLNSNNLNFLSNIEEKRRRFELIILNTSLSVLFLNLRICNLLHK